MASNSSPPQIQLNPPPSQVIYPWPQLTQNPIQRIPIYCTPLFRLQEDFDDFEYGLVNANTQLRLINANINLVIVNSPVHDMIEIEYNEIENAHINTEKIGYIRPQDRAHGVTYGNRIVFPAGSVNNDSVLYELRKVLGLGDGTEEETTQKKAT